MAEAIRSCTQIATILNNVVWYKALHLEERMLGQRTCIHAAQSHESVVDECAQQRIQSWKEHPAFAHQLRFADRLQLEGIKEDELCAIFSEPLECLKGRISSVPDWLSALAQALTDGTAPFDFTNADITHEHSHYQFLAVLAPLLTSGLNRLQEGIQLLAQQYTYIPFEPDTILAQLYANITPLLLSRANRTFVLEMHIARLQEKLGGYARGAVSQFPSLYEPT